MSSSYIGNNQFDLDQGIAIKEVGRVFDLIKKLQALLQFNKTNGGNEAKQMHELAQSLFGESLQALNNALCVMKSSKIKSEIKSEISMDETGSPAYSRIGSPVSNESDQNITSGKNKKRRVESYSWTDVTSMPYDDGYQWRKYGEKKISGSDFPRGYFRCTYKDGQDCKATKLVQQKDNNYPPSFDVKYANKHTCNSFKQIIAPFQTHSNQFTSISSHNGSDQMTSFQDHNQLCMMAQAHESSNKASSILYTQNCNDIMAQSRSFNQASCLQDDHNLSEIISGASMVPSSSDWDLDSFLMDSRWSEEDSFLLQALNHFDSGNDDQQF